MPRIPILSRAAIADISQMKDRIARIEQAAGIAPTERPNIQQHHLVRAPEGGLPARVGDTPGEATCLIVKRWGSAVPKELDYTSHPLKVYNYTLTAIPEGTMFVAHRDPWGDWWASDGGASDCDELGLSPGVYRGIAGALIDPGETGSVAIDTDDGIVGTVYEAINQTECPVVLGDRISIEVSPDCQAFFTTCKCCDGSPPDCCDRKIAICICNVQKIVSVLDIVGTTWDVSACCDCEGATLTILLSCVGDVITADWSYECGAVTDSGEFDLSELCSEDDVTITDQILLPVCNLCDKYSNTFITDCADCPPPDPCTSCMEFIDYTADKSGVPGTDEDIGVNTADLSVTRSVTCNGQRVTVNFTVTNNTGSLWESVPSPSEDAYLYFAWTDSTGSHANVTYIGATPAPVRGPGAGALIYDDQVDWDISIANGGTANFSITFELAASGTNGMAFEVAVVRGFRGTGQFDDEACP